MQNESFDMLLAAVQHAQQLNRFSDLDSLRSSESFRYFTGLFSFSGINTYTIANIAYELGKHSADSGINFSIAAHLSAGIFPVMKYGSNDLKEYISGKSESGALVANAITESSSGSDSFSMKSTARKTGDHYVLNGAKSFVTNGPIADFILVYAMTDPAKGFFGGVSCFLLEKGKHNFTTGEMNDKTALHSSPMCEVYLNDIIVSEDRLIGKEGAGGMIFLNSMNVERAVIAALHSGTMERLCSIVSEHVKKRVRGETTLASFQAVQFRIAEIALLAETSKWMAIKAAKSVDGSDGTLEAAQAKVLVSENFVSAARQATELLGGYGIMKNSPLGQALSDAHAALIYSGPNDVLRHLIASKL